MQYFNLITLSSFQRIFRIQSILFLFVFCLFVPRVQAASSSPSVEYQVKASLVFNFLNFVTWPEQSAGEQEEFRICLFGPDYYGNALGILQGEIVQGRRVNIEINPALSANIAGNIAELCHVIIFTERNRTVLKEWQKVLASKAVLTIGETEDFLNEGGVIRLLIADENVQFEINLEQAKQNRLVLSTKLLRLAHKVLS